MSVKICHIWLINKYQRNCFYDKLIPFNYLKMIDNELNLSEKNINESTLRLKMISYRCDEMCLNIKNYSKHDDRTY